MIKIRGIPTSPGIAIGEAFVYKKAYLKIKRHSLNAETEIYRFKRALEEVKKQIKELRRKALKEISEKEAAIFDSHLMILEDPAFIDKVKKYIREEGLSAEEAVLRTTKDITAIFETMEDEYLKTRIEDIRDLENQILEKLTGMKGEFRIKKPSVIVAKELLPSDTIKMRKEYILAFVTELGGVTSHVSIIARAMGVPAVVGIRNLTKIIKDGDIVIVDGYRGLIIVNPKEEVLRAYRIKMEEDRIQRERFKKICKLPAITKDGVEFKVAANISEPTEVYLAIENGADGIGLLRTEFLVMNLEKFPTEEEMAKELRRVISRFENKTVVVRTLDIGGDKPVPCLRLPRESNPFLGLRGIRLSLSKKEMFKSQIKAILRNNSRGNIKIMFPMVSLVEEVIEAKKIVKDAIKELESEGVRVGRTEIGVMIETPSAALMVNELAEYVDFFSIGTNDLTQYTLAVDRTNDQVAYIFDHLHPSILRLIKHVIEIAHKRGKWVSVCGEMASDVDAIPVLVGLKIDEFSVAPLFIPKIKGIIRSITYSGARRVAIKALRMRTANEVRELSRNFLMQEFKLNLE